MIMIYHPCYGVSEKSRTYGNCNYFSYFFISWSKIALILDERLQDSRKFCTPYLSSSYWTEHCATSFEPQTNVLPTWHVSWFSSVEILFPQITLLPLSSLSVEIRLSLILTVCESSYGTFCNWTRDPRSVGSWMNCIWFGSKRSWMNRATIPTFARRNWGKPQNSLVVIVVDPAWYPIGILVAQV
jgi:hypothetical protein